MSEILRVNLSVIELSVHDYYEVSEDVKRPAQVASDNSYLDCSRVKQLLYQPMVAFGQAFVYVSYTLWQRLFQGLQICQ